MKISLVLNVDTRKGCHASSTRIGDFMEEELKGCRSLDFIYHGLVNKKKFFEGHDLETIVFIDEHERLPTSIRLQLAPECDKLICEPQDRKSHRWNDRLYLNALRHCTGDYIAHFDGDCAAFKREGFDILQRYMNIFSTGAKFICQPTQLPDHGMTHASTRFFFCKRDTLDLPELEKLLDDKYRSRKFPNQHLPCLEHILTALHGPSFYPIQDNTNYTVFSWVQYFAGVLPKLNAMNYDEVYDYMFNKCGGIHGASDVVGVNL